MKGTIAYEILEIIRYWKTISGMPKASFKIEKIKFGAHALQYGLLCIPEGSTVPEKLVYYLHGGGWMFGNPGMFLANAYPFIERGYWVFLPTYRRVPKYNYFHMEEDVSRSLEQLNAELNLSNKEDFSWMIGGVSAGANLAANLSLDPNLMASLGRPITELKGTFLCGPPLELREMKNTPVLRFFAGKETSELFKKANPIDKLEKGAHSPYFIIQGTKDGLVRWKNVLSFVERFKETQNQELIYHEIENGTHLDAVKWTYLGHPLRAKLMDWVVEKMEG
ncbi:MAG: alpha/beta hydrolase [Saprospiraceae bacterium]|nr:alpha/beta hydrolase [Saprospiraceae bacterium]